MNSGCPQIFVTSVYLSLTTMKSKLLFSGIILSSIIVVACTPQEQQEVTEVLTEDTTTNDSAAGPTDTEPVVDNTGTEITETAPQPAQDTECNDSGSAAPAENYSAYSEAALATAQQNGQAVIFFHADWCPSCKAGHQDILSNGGDIPADVTILKADYDTETDLKQKYGVTAQDTFVLVDANGELVKKWNGGGKAVSALLSNL